MTRQFTAAALATLALLSAAPATTAAQTDLLVTTEWLADNLDHPDVVVLHVGNADSYAQSHLPGARLLDPADFSPAIDGMVVQMPEAAALRDALETAGVSADSRIIVYSASNPPQAGARAYLTLENFGLAGNASILDGGLTAWQAEGRPVSTEPVSVARGTLPLLSEGTELVVDHEYVAARLSDGVTAIIDARDPQFWSGEAHMESLAARPGRVPSAHNVVFRSLVDEHGRMLPTEQLAEAFANAGVDGDAPLVTYCHVGQQASLVTLAARLLDRDVHLYDGSYQDWSQRAELPVETGP